jgi:hypothetical protein
MNVIKYFADFMIYYPEIPKRQRHTNI